MGVDGRARTRAGSFENVVTILETNDLDPTSIATKLYAPGVGFIQDAGLQLQSCSGGPRPPCNH